jgi:hypothetical protein
MVAHCRFRGRNLAHTSIMAVVLALTAATLAHAQIVQPDSAMLRARHAFDFLIGRWQVAFSQIDSTRTTSTGETYTFERLLTDGTLGGPWHFNRGTADKPDFVNALYYSAYNNATRSWSFYYISPQSGQAWAGFEQGGRWYFMREFTANGVTSSERQWWESVTADTVRRHIETSTDRGTTWKPVITITLRRG